MSPDQIVTVVFSFVGGGGLAAVLIKLLNRNVDSATAEATLAGSRKADIENLRSIISELRISEAKKGERVDKLEERIDKLEERERHMLTRAAVHEAWDQMAFSMLIASNPQHPPPPPLLPSEIERGSDDDS